MNSNSDIIDANILCLLLFDTIKYEVQGSLKFNNITIKAI